MPGTYAFLPMLGPARNQPEGSFEQAECLGNCLDYVAERAVEDGVDRLLKEVRVILPAHPWLVWPDPPCETADAFFLLCTGLTYGKIHLLIDTFIPDHGLPSPDRVDDWVAERIADADVKFLLGLP